MFVYTDFLFWFVLCWDLNSLDWQESPVSYPIYPQRFTLGFDSQVWLPYEEPSKCWILASELSLVRTYKSPVWLRSTRDYILSQMNIEISFSSKLKIPNRPCNCLDFSNRKLLSLSISLIIIDNLDLIKVDTSNLSIWEPWRSLSWPDRELLYSGYIYKRLYNNKSAYFTMLNKKKTG